MKKGTQQTHRHFQSASSLISFQAAAKRTRAVGTLKINNYFLRVEFAVGVDCEGTTMENGERVLDENGGSKLFSGMKERKP